jgi:hypothetical protein
MLLIMTGSASPRIENVAATGAAPAVSDGRPRPVRSVNGRGKNPKDAECEPSLLWTITGLALALASAVLTMEEGMVGVVVVNVDVTGRKACPSEAVAVVVTVMADAELVEGAGKGVRVPVTGATNSPRVVDLPFVGVVVVEFYLTEVTMLESVDA